jgi:hypothetical protein
MEMKLPLRQIATRDGLLSYIMRLVANKIGLDQIHGMPVEDEDGEDDVETAIVGFAEIDADA